MTKAFAFLSSLALLLALPQSAWAQRPLRVIPDAATVVLETLPPGARAFTTPTAAAGPTLSRIEQMLQAAARSGDTRLSTRAHALLARLPADVANTPDAIRARAFSAQHRHRFDEARDLTSQLLRSNPRDGGALLSRAQINIVQGHLNKARSDCANLALRVDSALGMICAAALEMRMGRYAGSAQLLDRWLDAGNEDPGLARFARVMRGEAASRMAEPDAGRWFRDALELDPADVRTRLAYARHLRHVRRPAEALSVLAPAIESDTVLLQRALAAREAARADAGLLAGRLGRRFVLARQTGSDTELRDEAEYHLELRKDAARGLQLALENFRTQRDREDQALLQAAARMAERPAALQSLHAWARAERLPAAALAEDAP